MMSGALLMAGLVAWVQDVVPGIETPFASHATMFGVLLLTGNCPRLVCVAIWPAGVSTSVFGPSSAADQALPQGPG